ncbi:Rap1 Myb domain protein, partial [Opisthorchis viverrini]
MPESSIDSIPPSLFVLPNGTQMTFTLHRCSDFFALLPLVVAGGGVLEKRVRTNSILLAEAGSLVESDRYIHVQYVRDCIRARRRLPMDGYKVTPGIHVPEIPSRVPHADASVPYLLNRRTRKPFTKIESESVKNYISKHGLQDKVHGHSIWRSMEQLGITSHSAEGMRAHYLHLLARDKESKRLTKGSRAKPVPFTVEEDGAILDYVKRNNLSGSRFVNQRKIWEEMNRCLRMRHSAESMRSRFRRRLLEKLSSSEDDKLDDISISETSDVTSRTENTASTSTAITSSPQRRSSIRFSQRITRTRHSRMPRRITLSRLFPVSPVHTERDLSPMDISPLDELVLPSDSHHSSDPRNSDELPPFVTYLMNASKLLTSPLQVYILLSMTNGSVTQTLNFIRTGLRHPNKPAVFNPPLWTPEADAQLKSTELSVLCGLIERFGANEIVRTLHLSFSIGALYKHRLSVMPIHTPLSPSPSEKLLGPGHGPGVWPLRERLALASALLDVDNQQASWQAIGKKLARFTTVDRPGDWCSARACAKQYALLLDSAELTRRQKSHNEIQATRVNILHATQNPVTPGLSITERLVKRLTAERVEELRERIELGQKYYGFLKTMHTEIQEGLYDNHLEKLCEVMNIPLTSERDMSVSDTEESQISSGSRETRSKSASKSSTQAIDEKILEFAQSWSEVETMCQVPKSVWICPPGIAAGKTTKNICSGTAGAARLNQLLNEASATFRSSGSKPPLAVLGRRSRLTVKSAGETAASRNTTATTRAAVATRQRYLANAARNRAPSTARVARSLPTRARKVLVTVPDTSLDEIQSTVYRSPTQSLRPESMPDSPSLRRASTTALELGEFPVGILSGASTPSTTAMCSSDTDELSDVAAEETLGVSFSSDSSSTDKASDLEEDEAATPAMCATSNSDASPSSSQMTEAASHVTETEGDSPPDALTDQPETVSVGFDSEGTPTVRSLVAEPVTGEIPSPMTVPDPPLEVPEEVPGETSSSVPSMTMINKFLVASPAYMEVKLEASPGASSEDVSAAETLPKTLEQKSEPDTGTCPTAELTDGLHATPYPQETNICVSETPSIPSTYSVSSQPPTAVSPKVSGKLESFVSATPILAVSCETTEPNVLPVVHLNSPETDPHFNLEYPSLDLETLCVPKTDAGDFDKSQVAGDPSLHQLGIGVVTAASPIDAPSPAVCLSLLNDSELTCAKSPDSPPPILIQPDKELAVELSPFTESDYLCSIRVVLEKNVESPSVSNGSQHQRHENMINDNLGDGKNVCGKDIQDHRTRRPHTRKRKFTKSIEKPLFVDSPFVSLPTLDADELALLGVQAEPSPTVKIEPLSSNFSPIRPQEPTSLGMAASGAAPLSVEEAKSTPTGKKQRSLRLRLSRKGSHMVVVPSSSTSSVTTASPTLSGLGDEPFVQIKPDQATTWQCWCSDILDAAESALQRFSFTASPSKRLHNISSESEETGRKSVLRIVETIRMQLRDGSITSRPQFVHHLLAALANLVMRYSSDTVQFAAATYVYNIVGEHLTTNLWSTPSSVVQPLT